MVIPFTSNLYCGLLVPIPTLPVESILTFSVPLVLKISLLVPIALIFKSPEFDNNGVDNEVVPVTVVPVMFAVPVFIE